MGTIQAAGPEDEDGPGPWEISGLWLFRGTDMLVNPDSEYYTWTKVDVSTDAGKAKVKECFIGDTVNGKKVRDPASSRKRSPYCVDAVTIRHSIPKILPPSKDCGVPR